MSGIKKIVHVGKQVITPTLQVFLAGILFFLVVVSCAEFMTLIFVRMT